MNANEAIEQSNIRVWREYYVSVEEKVYRLQIENSEVNQESVLLEYPALFSNAFGNLNEPFTGRALVFECTFCYLVLDS